MCMRELLQLAGVGFAQHESLITLATLFLA